MKLIYNGTDLAALGKIRILSHSIAREPVEAPQRERVTYRVRLDFFQQSYEENYGLIEQLRAAMKAAQASLLWEDDSGSTYLNRTVTAGNDEAPEEAGARGGTYWQALVFSFWFYNHDVVTSCLQATFTGTGEGLSLGAVIKWQEKLDITRWDELRANRKQVRGGVTASGQLLADTTQPVATRQKELLAMKDALEASVSGVAEGTLVFGTFNRKVRVTHFQVDVDQPNNAVNWSLAATYTVFPNEQNYYLLDLRIASRENREDSIPRLTLSGKIGAASVAAAQAKLALLQGSLVPTGYILLNSDSTQNQLGTESTVGGAAQGDGNIFTELNFTLEYRDSTGKNCTFQRTGSSTPVVSLGTVDRFRTGYAVTLFDQLRPHRREGKGTVTIGGRWFVAESLSAADKEKALVQMEQTLDTEVVKGNQGTLIYASIFNQAVRIIDRNVEVNRLKYFIEWTLTATYNRYPNESDYALVDLRIATKQDRTEGTKILSLTGKIGAPTEAAARGKLARLRTSLVPAGYVLKTDNTEANRLESENNFTTTNDGDGATFTELTVSEDWQATLGNVLSYRMRHIEDQDVKSPWIRSVYSGTVTASASTADTAFATAEAKAASLGDGKYPFQLRSTITENSFQVLTDNQVIVTIEFVYEYQRKATSGEALIYTEVTGELSHESFGYSVETVSGMISAPSLAAAQAVYLADVRNTGDYDGCLLLNERKLVLSSQRLADGGGNALTSGDDRFTFSFQVFQPKGATETAITYTLQADSNVLQMEQRTVVTGVVYAADEATARGTVDQLMGTLSLGKRIRYARVPRYQQGPPVSGGAAAVSAFMALDFREEWVDILSGVEGLLECEVTEDVTYVNPRRVVKNLPDNVPIIQSPGYTAGGRVVTARALATTETAATAWVKSMRAGLLASANGDPNAFEEAPRITPRFKFLPLTDGVPRGTGANPQLVEVSGQFSEILLALVLT